MKTTTLILTVLLGAGVLLAQRGPADRGPRAFGAQADQLKEFLNLEDQQLQDLRDVQKSLREAALPLREQMKEKAQALRQARQQDDAGLVTQLEAEIANLRAEEQNLRTHYRENALGILNAEQKEKLAVLQQALELVPAATTAVGLNLVDAPKGPLGRFAGPRTRNSRAGIPPRP